MITPKAPAFITGSALPRRTILRGIGAAIGLPFLEAMSPARAAGAGLGKPPVRMAFFYVPNGIVMDAWNPDYEGPFRELPRALKALEPYKQDMLQIGNLTHNTGRALLDGAGDHGRCCGSYLTGGQVKKSVVEIMHVLLSICQTAASSPVSVPTSRRLKGGVVGVSANREARVAGDSLQPHPPPCAIRLSRTRSDGILYSRLFARLHP